MNPLNNIKMRNKFEHEIAKDNIYKKMHITKLGGRAMHIEIYIYNYLPKVIYTNFVSKCI